MDNFMYVAFMVYTIIGVCVVAFAVCLLPSIILSTWDYLSDRFRSFDILWDESRLKQLADGFVNEKLHPFILDVREHYEFLRQEKGRHTKDIEEFFSTAVQEFREVNEGRRMPVSINGL